MDPEELFAQLEAEEEEAPRRMAPTRRTVLGETSITAGEPTRYDASGEVDPRDATGPEVDADAPLVGAPEASYAERGKAAPSGPTDAQRARWEVETGQTMQRGIVEPVSPVWDTVRGATQGRIPGRPTPEQARTDEHLSRFWDQFTSSDARLGGRDPIRPIVGRDQRAEAPIARIFQGLPIHIRDDEERAALEGRAARATSQAPELAAAGDAALVAGYAAMPNPASMAGRVGLSAATGGAVAGAHSLDSPVQDALVGAGIGAGAGLLGEAASRATGALTNPRAAADRLSQSASRSQRAADQARLEASGVWGGHAMRAAEDLPGGTERLAGDLRRLGVGERGPGRASFDPSPPPRGMTIPRMDRAAEDSEAIRRAAGSQMAVIAREADQAGAQVSTLGVRSRVEDLAQELDRLPIGGRESAGQLREMTLDLANGGDLTFRDAWAQRQMLDDMIGSYQRDPNLSRLSGRLQTVRDALHAEMTRAAQDVGLGRAWQGASRDAQVGIFMRDFGRGHQRLSVGGGMGGANAAGDIIADAVASGSPGQVAMAVPRQMASRVMAQETRMAFPGVRARVGETSASMQRGAADVLYQLAQRNPERLGRYARPLLEAGARGGTALLTTMHTLMQRDAEARRIFEEAQGLSEQE